MCSTPTSLLRLRQEKARGVYGGRAKTAAGAEAGPPPSTAIVAVASPEALPRKTTPSGIFRVGSDSRNGTELSAMTSSTAAPVGPRSHL